MSFSFPLAGLLFLLMWLVLCRRRNWYRPRRPQRALVVVGGDFARSPRMQYHAVSLADSGVFAEVVCVGLDCGNRCCEDVLQRQRSSSGPRRPPGSGAIELSLLSDSAGLSSSVLGSSRVPWIARAVWVVLQRTLFFSLRLWRWINRRGGPSGCETSLIIVQTPPAIPFLPILWLLTSLHSARSSVCAALLGPGFRLAQVKLIVDWHNFGFTLLDIERRPRWVVAAYRAVEKFFGPAVASESFTVSAAMKAALTSTPRDPPMGVGGALPCIAGRFTFLPPQHVHVLRDTAPSFFSPFSRREFFAELSALGDAAELRVAPSWMRRPASDGLLIASSTSWTADDDYTLVVDAMKMLDAHLAESAPAGFRVWLVVSGKGPARARFEKQVEDAALSDRVAVTTVFFSSMRRYACFLGSSDVGLCVHRSSSGLDLPMKVVDMFGCGLPVAAVRYPALDELVTHESGWLFSSAEELRDSLIAILRDKFSGRNDDCSVLGEKRRYVEKVHASKKWADNWNSVALPIVQRLCVPNGGD